MSDIISSFKDFIATYKKTVEEINLGNDNVQGTLNPKDPESLFDFGVEEYNAGLDSFIGKAESKKGHAAIESKDKNTEKITGYDVDNNVTYVIENNAKNLNYPTVSSWSGEDAVISFDDKNNILKLSKGDKAVINPDGTVIKTSYGRIVTYDKRGNIISF